MRLLVLDQFSELGGAQRCLLDLMPALLDRRWDVRVLLPGDGPLVGALRGLGVPVQLVSCGPYSSGRKTLRDVVRFVGDYNAIASAVQTQTSDLIYVNGPRMLPAAARGCRGTPVLFHSHSYLSQRYAVPLVGRSLKRSGAAVIASSDFVGAPWRRYADVQTIYNGTAEIPFQPKLAPRARRWRIGLVGRIAPEKGQLEFVSAARHVSDATFYVYGAPLWSSDSYYAKVRSAAEGLDVHFAGWRDAVGAILHELDLLVVPSPSYESTTRVILEAFSAGTPVIAFATGGIPEVVTHGTTGFLTDSTDLTKQIREVIQHADRLPEIVKAARQEWNNRFTLSRYCAGVTEAMELAARRVSSGNKKAATSITPAATPSTGA
jgi:glycosyltransferase involved in cell wall biosynthesis